MKETTDKPSRRRVTVTSRQGGSRYTGDNEDQKPNADRHEETTAETKSAKPKTRKAKTAPLEPPP